MVRLLRDGEIRGLVNIPDAVACLEGGYRADARGEVVLFPRNRFESEKVSIAYLGAAVPSEGVLGFRTYLHGSNGGDRGHQIVVLYGYPDMTIQALFLGRSLGNLRTGGALAAALRLMEPNAREIGLIGTGTQARSALACIAATSPLSRTIAWSPNRDHREAFKAWAERELHVPVELGTSPSEIVRVLPTVVLATATDRTVITADSISEPKLFLSISAYRRPEFEESILDEASTIWTDSVVQAGGPGTFFESSVRRKKLAPLGTGIANGTALDRSSTRIVINTGAAWEEVLLGKHLLKRAESENCGSILGMPDDEPEPAPF